MALSLLGVLNKCIKPGLLPLALRSSEVDFQSRNYAARKGTRERKLKIKLAMKLKRAAEVAKKEKMKTLKKKVGNVRNPSDFSHLLDCPKNLSVYVSSLYKPKSYSLEEALACHRENLHPTLYDNPNAAVHLLFELNMVAEKSTRFVEPWKSLICLPHDFQLGRRKTVLVLCDEASVKTAIDCGADKAGGTELIQDIKEGNLNVKIFDVVIGHTMKAQELTYIRAKLKPFVLKAQDGTLTDDIPGAIRKHKYGIPYECYRSELAKNFGWIDVDVGTIDMDDNKLKENIAAFFKDVCLRWPKREGDFIRWLWCSCPPSPEIFSVDIQPFLDAIPKPQLKTAPKSREPKSGSVEERLNEQSVKAN